MAADDLDLATTPALAAAERDGRPAFAVDADGAVAWASGGARALIGSGPLDPATRRTLARMAASGSGGLLRLRLGALGSLSPLVFQARPFVTADGAPMLAVEGLARAAEPAAETRDVAEEERADEAAAAAFDAAEAAPQAPDRDPPPDPRRDLVTVDAAHAPEEPDAPVDERAESVVTPAESDEPLRFAFEIDAQSHLSLVSPDLEKAVGASASGIVGRAWDDIAAELGLDPDGAVAAALARRGGWGDIRIGWPLGDGRRRTIALSALPMFDRGRSFVGFRGLGRSIEELAPVAGQGGADTTPASERAAIEDAPEAAEMAAAPSVEEASAPIAAVSDETQAAASDDAPAETPAHEPPSIVMVPPPPAPVFHGNVVPLREPPAPQPALSSSEEDAFDEIARRLKAFGPRAGDESLTLEPETPEPPHVPTEDERPPIAAGPDELLRLIDRMPVGSLVLRGGRVTHANRAALEMLGAREIADLAGRSAETLFADALPKDREGPSGAMRLIAADGGEVDVDARLSTIAWGGAPATLVVLRRPDPAATAAAESAQRERELAASLDISTDGVMTLDGQGRILSVNRGAETLFGFSAREVTGSLFTLSLAPESRRAAFDCLDRVKSSAAAQEPGVEVMGLARQGGAAPLLMTIGRLPGAGDRFCAALRDIGPWKRAEEELIASRRLAERANDQKSDFLAKVSHEIRTPLNAIIGFAEVMRDERFGPIGSPRYKDYLKDIQSSGAHLVKMMDDLLDVSRIETGKLKLDMSPLDLNEIASQAAALLQPQANRGRVIIRTSLARGLPQVMADRRSVRQIMTNLAMNAVKLSRPGGQVIVATALTDIGQAVFRVRDAGAGLSKQELARAFEPFRPLDVADNDAGSGLGLPLTRALAEANDAALALQSELGLGTLAEVTFPASRVLAS